MIKSLYQKNQSWRGHDHELMGNEMTGIVISLGTHLQNEMLQALFLRMSLAF